MNYFKAATSQVNITPPIGYPLAGTRKKRISTGKKDELLAKVIIINKDENYIVIVSCDVLALNRETINNIRTSIKTKLGISENNILISATHTHTGPATVPIFNTGQDECYMQLLEQKITGAIENAYNNLEPVIIKHGIGNENNITFNRRILLKDGRMIIAGLEDEPKVDNIKEVEGPIDPEVSVVSIEKMNGEIMGILYNFACHADIVTGDKYSADFPYYVQEFINRVYDRENITVLYLNGASGNINHLNEFKPEEVESRSRYFDREGLKKCRKFSRILGSEILKTVLKAEPLTGQKVATERKILEIEVRKPTEEELEWSKNILQSTDLNKICEKNKTAAQEIIRLKELQKKDASVEIEIAFIKLGDIVFVTIPGEVFVEIALKIKELSPYENTFIVTLANGYEGYIPTQKAFQNGGYEAKSAYSSKLARNTEEILIKEISEVLEYL